MTEFKDKIDAIEICVRIWLDGSIFEKMNLMTVRFTYNEDKNVIMTVTGSASQMRGSGYLPRQAAVSWVQTNRSEQEFSVLKNL